MNSRKTQAEAVAWLARLQAPGRNRALEEGLRHWISASPENGAAFEEATDLWNELGGVSAAALLRRRQREQRAEIPRRWMPAVALASIVAAIVSIAVLWDSDSGLETRVGEQRMVTLKDGSRVALNTNSRVVVESWNGTRELRLERGEAYFEVSRDPARPFVVIAGDKQVVAIGTAFVVRRDDGDRISVTLIEGKVAITDVGVKARALLDHPASAPTLAAGERMVVARAKPAPEIDRPSLDAVTAWRRGEVVLNETSLKDAATEMNRYSEVALVTPDASADLKVSGIFRAGDSESFAAAVATLYGLQVARDSNRIVLSGNP